MRGGTATRSQKRQVKGASPARADDVVCSVTAVALNAGLFGRVCELIPGAAMRFFTVLSVAAFSLALEALAFGADVGVIPKLSQLADMKPVAAPLFVPKPFQIDALETGALSTRSNWVMPGQRERYGHAVALIEAPAVLVRKQISMLAQYKELVPSKFNTARVVRKKGTESDLYVQVPLKIGGIVLWGVARFTTIRPVEGSDEGGGQVEILEGKLLTGNFSQFHLIWTLKAIDEKRTALACDMLMGFDVPAPQSAVDEELRDACGEGIDGVVRLMKDVGVKTPAAKR